MSSKIIYIIVFLVLILPIGCINPAGESLLRECEQAASALYFLSREVEQEGIYRACIGDQPEIVISGDAIQEYALSVEKNNLVYIQQDENDGTNIWLFDLDQNQKFELQDCENDLCENLVISPDGKDIFFSRYGEDLGLYKVSVGTSETTLISSFYSDWIDISPSGDYLRVHEPASGLIRVLSLVDFELLLSFPGDTDLVGSWDSSGQKFVMGERNVNGELLASEFVEIDVHTRSQDLLFSLPIGIEFFRPIYANQDTFFVLSRSGVRNNSRVIQRIAQSGDVLQTITNAVAYDHSSLQWNTGDELLSYQRFDVTQSNSTPEILAWDFNSGITSIIARNAVQPRWQD